MTMTLGWSGTALLGALALGACALTPTPAQAHGWGGFSVQIPIPIPLPFFPIYAEPRPSCPSYQPYDRYDDDPPYYRGRGRRDHHKRGHGWGHDRHHWDD